MKKLAIILLTAICFCAKAGDPKFPVSAIPEDLKKGMYAVIRLKEIRVEVNSINSSSYYYHTVITILNANAKNYAAKGVGYDKLNKVKSFNGVAYDAGGNVIKKLKQNEIYDQSNFDGLFSDSRSKSADLSQGIYPYTVEFEYEIEQKYLYSLPDFYLYSDDEVSIQKTTYTIVYPKELNPRYKVYNMQEPKSLKIDNSREALEWSFENIKPEKFEKFGPAAYKVIPNAALAPIEFEYEGYIGKMDTWENFGKWNMQLNAGRDLLPEATKQTILKLTQNAKSTEEKARILYEYLQNKTRYVSIQLGIGGLQPFPAKVVDETGYGDCKALSNYMVALLKEVGIKSYYTTIMSGEAEEFDTTFPTDQSDHIIVAVPNQKDTIWLECTSQTNPFGYLGTFTGDRYGLMLTEEGGKLVKTISYSTEQNTKSRTADVIVQSDGNAKAKIRTHYSGTQYENGGLDYYATTQYDDQKKWVQKNTSIPVFDINSFKMTNIKDKIPTAIVDLDLTLNRFATVSGKRVFITPNLMNRSTYIPEKVETRKTNVVRKSTYTDLDTIRYHLPEGIYPEFLPTPIKLKNRFGEYEASFKLDQDNLLYIRKVKMNKGEFPAESYTELIEFYRSMNKADNTKIVFLSKT